MGHGIKECSVTLMEVKNLPKDDFPYSLALKAKFNFFREGQHEVRFIDKKAMS